MIDRDLPRLAAAAGVTLAGSLIAVAPKQRPAITEELVAHGHWVHADIIGGSYRGQVGVDLDELRVIRDVHGIRLDVHLMVDDPMEALAALPEHVHRITVQVPATADVESVVAAARGQADEVWLSIDVRDPSKVEATLAANVEGMLVMLTPPGKAGFSADLRMLDVTRSVAAAGLTIGIDGGVNATNFVELVDADVQYAVAGRGLLR